MVVSCVLYCRVGVSVIMHRLQVENHWLKCIVLQQRFGIVDRIFDL